MLPSRPRAGFGKSKRVAKKQKWILPFGIATIKTYYLRALSAETGGFPLIMTMMLMAITGALLQVRDSGIVLWARLLSLLLVIPPVALAGVRVVPNARILASTNLDPVQQSEFATLILQDHLYCFGSILAFLFTQLWLTLKN